MGGSIRLLKNIGGLWLLQACRRAWAAAGRSYEYEELLDAAAGDALAFRSLVDPDYSGFLNPDNMVAAIDAYCRRTDQPEPATPPAYVRTILESLAFKYRLVLEALETYNWDVQKAVAHIACQGLPVPQGVGHGLAHGALGQHPGLFFLQPLT